MYKIPNIFYFQYKHLNMVTKIFKINYNEIFSVFDFATIIVNRNVKNE